MADLRSLLTVFGPLGVIGILLIAAAPIGLAGINPLDAGKLATSLTPAQLVGLSLLGAGLILLVWRIAERRSETTISEADARTLRKQILPALNRQAVLRIHYRHDLRARFASIRAARIQLQKTQNHLVSVSLRSMVAILIELLREFDSYSPWGDERNVSHKTIAGRVSPERAIDFDEWWAKRLRNWAGGRGESDPIVVLLIAAVQTAEGSQQDSRTARHYPIRREPEIGEAEAGGASIYYEAMLALMERMLDPVRLVISELDRLSSHVQEDGSTDRWRST